MLIICFEMTEENKKLTSPLNKQQVISEAALVMTANIQPKKYITLELIINKCYQINVVLVRELTETGISKAKSVHQQSLV